jgi:selenocysteine-specific elongation factor
MTPAASPARDRSASSGGCADPTRGDPLADEVGGGPSGGPSPGGAAAERPSSSARIPSPPPAHDAPLVLGTAGQSTRGQDDSGRLPLVLGTAGHIDHGKTALITLLTGKNTDRLREERERGISIELGYAELELPTGRRLSVVDVPGHERFVRTMVAGATGVDLFLLVVAADDGVMPQTVEHLAILELLGVPGGVVALTKADLVDDELLEMAKDDVESFLAGTAYAGAPVVTVSSRDGRGIPQLIGALEEAAAGAARRKAEGAARLAVDRVFTLKGIGTIATGTLWRGRITAGDALRVEPGGVAVTARSVEVHDHAAEAGLAGQRVGVNVRVIGKESLERGRWLVADDVSGAVTAHFDAWLQLLPNVRPLRHGERLRLHHGTAQHLVRVVLLDRKELAGGQAAAVTLRLEDEIYVEPNDRFILRALSPVATVGGGVALDVAPPHWHDRDAHAAFVNALRDGDAAEAVARLAAARGEAGLSAEDFARTAIEPAAAQSALNKAAGRSELDELVRRAAAAGAKPGRGPADKRWFAAGTLERVRAALKQSLARRADERPDKPAAGLAELASVAPHLRPADLETVVAELVQAGTVVAVEGGVALAGVGGVLAADLEDAAARALELVTADAFSPPTLAMLLEEVGLPRRDLLTLLAVLVRRGQLVRVNEDLWFSSAAVDEARERLLVALAQTPQITLADFRDLLNTGRRNAQALLEHFDGEGLTRRLGEARILRGRR